VSKRKQEATADGDEFDNEFESNQMRQIHTIQYILNEHSI